MKMFPKVIASVIGMTATLGLSAQAQNLLVDPDFAGPFTANPITTTSGSGGTTGVGQGWALFNASSSSSTAQVEPGATTSLLVVNAPGNNWNPNGAYQIVGGLTPGQQYTFTMEFLTDTGTTYGTPVDLQLNFGSLVGITWTTAAGGGNGWGFGPAPAGSIPSLNTWYSHSITAVAPAGATEASIYVMFMDNGQTAAENVYFDSGSLVATPEPATIALLGMGLGLPFYFLRRRHS